MSPIFNEKSLAVFAKILVFNEKSPQKYTKEPSILSRTY